MTSHRALVFGSSGYLGGRIVAKLSEDGWDVFTIDRGMHSKFEWAEVLRGVAQHRRAADSWEELESAMSERVFQSAFVCAASTEKEDDYRAIQKLVDANLSFHALAMKLCVEIGVAKAIAFSTFSSSFDGRNYLPQSFYAATKEASSDLSRWFSDRYDIAIAHLELTDVYGPGQPHYRLIPSLVRALWRGEDFSMTQGHQKIAPLFIDDAVSAAMFTRDLEFEGVKTWAVRSEETVQVREIPAMLASLMSNQFGKVINSKISHDRPNRYREIMEVKSRFPTLPNWHSQMPLSDGLVSLIRELWEVDV